MAEIKRSMMDSYYRAYREYVNSVKSINDYRIFKASLKELPKRESDDCSGSVAHREIDMTWVSAIEYALPYIDKSIREQRRFITQNEEIVPIQKSKKVSTESVRHLAQHTNMIGRVEDKKVTPKTILNIQREESFAIYENCFLRSAIVRTLDFVYRFIKQIQESQEQQVANLTLARESKTTNQVFNFDIRCHLDYFEGGREFKMDDNVSELTEFERVIRCRRILSDFLSTPLMVGLANSPEVRSPITRTNLLTKDQNFKEVVKLWDFLDNYRKPGFTLIAEDTPSALKPNMLDGIFDAMNMLKTVLQVNMSDKLRNVLEENYEAENRYLEEQKKLEEEAAERQVKKRIQDALGAQREEYEDKLTAAEEKRQKDLEENTQEWTEKLSQNINEYENKLVIKDQEKENALKEQGEAFDDEKKDIVGRYESLILAKDDHYAFETARRNEESQEVIRKMQADSDRKIEKLISDCKSEVEKVTSESKSELEKATSEYKSEIERITAESASSKEEMQKDFDERLDSQAELIVSLDEKNAELSRTVAELQKKIKALTKENEKLSTAVEKKEADFQKQYDKLRVSYNESINRKTEKLSKETAKLKKELESITERIKEIGGEDL